MDQGEIKREEHAQLISIRVESKAVNFEELIGIKELRPLEPVHGVSFSPVILHSIVLNDQIIRSIAGKIEGRSA
ncbi:hypothetical protein FGO68_gene5950 [Halteria grandinella]|uniref:Uncharacterized protein n=1 Tax=Halteria grandinella TaxID=5974 RepID=A0A8J8NHE5_HALGN|nr:hypothetical protein FGO68_gene5950 [Halteria grandinella]